MIKEILLLTGFVFWVVAVAVCVDIILNKFGVAIPGVAHLRLTLANLLSSASPPK